MDNKFFAILLFIALAIDHKSFDGSKWIVVISVILYGISSLNFLFNRSQKFKIDNNEARYVICLSAPICLSFIPLFFSELTLNGYLINIQSYVLAVVGYVMTIVFYKQNDIDWFLDKFFIACLLSVIFTFALGYVRYSGDLISARYSIISYASFFCLPYALYLFLSGRSLFIAIFSIFSIFYVALASTTRSYLFSIFLSFFIGILLFLYKRIVSKEENLRLFYLISSSCICFFVFSAFNQDMIFNWIERLNSSDAVGFDITTYTRLAEIDGQLSLLFKDLFSIVFGLGVGADYFWASIYDIQLLNPVGYVDLTRSYDYVGHNFWVYSIFANGVVFGLIFPCTLIFSFIKGFISLVKQKKISLEHNFGEKFEYHYVGVMGLLLTMLMTVGGNIMGLRSGGILVGVFVAICTIKNSDHKIVNDIN